MHSTRQSADLGWLLDDLLERVPTARQAVVLSADGLLLGCSTGMDKADAEHLCALASGLSSLARGASRHLTGGPVRQTVVEMEDAYLFVTAAGQGACLAVASDADADIGLVAYEMAMLVTRVGENLGTPTRASVGAADAH
ncbi:MULTISPECIES: roadblock/LC7 domain-containing protein [unclassified Micromonospora]|jgi:predicted regulator of Ras-like GTPase activity (Roadblock/LC7/MglB family)|uniref:roadblock/LC7 domain-containing protein n=1 Tax=unclassified Micromonospora TaxID=2617518 RepID=UPI0015916371|nr:MULTISPECIES: roadblock/LC7 domain-containing protein [unclassified Micromonospora]QKW15952.1 roadblock/LC7 domain-containing protein [Verrucosispora sp. NA02020]